MRTDLLALGAFGARSRLGERIEMLLARGAAFRGCSRLLGGFVAVALIAVAVAASFAPRWIASPNNSRSR
jgi:hypothetical protein